MRSIKMLNLKRVVGMFLVSASLTSCAGTNISGEWDCPKQNGYGCIDIERADELAIKKLAERQKNAATKGENTENELKQSFVNIREVWIAPFHDGNGHYYESTKIKYRE